MTAAPSPDKLYMWCGQHYVFISKSEGIFLFLCLETLQFVFADNWWSFMQITEV